MTRENAINLVDLVKDVPTVSARGLENVRITGLAYNSMMVKPGYLFFAIPGTKADGHNYIADAVGRGAAAVVAERADAVPAETPALVVESSRRALAKAAAVFHGDPSERVKVIGITGTNGKTTVAYLAYDMLRKGGFSPGLIGTIEYRVGRRTIPAVNTTPESLDIQSMLAELEAEGGDVMVMEVSSHALDQGRVDGVRFQTAVFTNLSRDHTDYHKTIEAYKTAKASLFDRLTRENHALFNVDDHFGAELAIRERCCATTFAVESDADLTVEHLELTLEGAAFTWRYPEGQLPVRLSLIGEHNVSNFLAAAGAALSLGVSPQAIVEAAEAFGGVPGRLERIEAGQDFVVLVDYAHTDDALEKVLGTLKQSTKGKLIVVFGCGGQRDQSKRPAMAAVAEKLADVVVVTSDNPRGEDPAAIIEGIRAGFSAKADYVVKPDRRKAIDLAVSRAQSGDTVLIAGKGHETYQVLADGMIHLDDREEARRALRAVLGQT